MGDYQDIATGIIKNPELYELYYNLQSSDEDGKSMPEKVEPYILSMIARLYRISCISGKDVLHLVNHIQEINLGQRADKEIVMYAKDVNTMLALVDYDYYFINARGLAETAKNFKRSDYGSWAEARAARKAILKDFKVLHKNTKILHQIEKLYLKNPGEEEPSTVISKLMQEHNKPVIKEILSKYTSGNADLRVKTSKYQSVLEPYIEDTNLRSIIESVLEAPELATKTYSYMLNNLNLKALELSSNEMTQKSLISLQVIERLKIKYSLLLDVAKNHVADPVELQKMLQKVKGNA